MYIITNDLNKEVIKEKDPKEEIYKNNDEIIAFSKKINEVQFNKTGNDFYEGRMISEITREGKFFNGEFFIKITETAGKFFKS
jgi:hypothetical protein